MLKLLFFMGMFFAGILLMLAGCTDNTMARSYGGTATVKLPAGYKLFDVTWKEDSLWYCVRKMREDEFPEEYEFLEDSPLGLLEGKVVFKESRK